MQNTEFEQNKSIQSFAGKSILITGGMGFIGSHLAKKLTELGANVYVLDINTSEKRDSLINDKELGIRNKIQIINGSIADAKFMKDLFGKYSFDVIYNLAAYASTVEKALSSPSETSMVNAMGVVTILEALRFNQRKPEVFFHGSTDKVYGELHGDAYLENHVLGGKGLYESAKLAGDVFTQSHHHVFDIPTVTLRMCNIFGPYDMNLNRLIPRSLCAIYSKEKPMPPILYSGSSSHSRDYLYIDDLINCILLLSAKPACRGEVFNAISCAHKSTPDMIAQLIKVAQSVEFQHNCVRAKQIEKNGVLVQKAEQSDKIVTITRQHLNSTKLYAAIGYSPKFSLEAGLTETVQFYRKKLRKTKTYR